MSEGQQRLPYPRLSPEGVGALRGVEHYLNAMSGLERSLLEMVRLRVSQINGCVFCIETHRHELLKAHEPESRTEAVESWHGNTEALTQRERTALGWAEAITDIQDGHASDAEYEKVRAHFSEKETVDLTLAISVINAWNRLAIAFRPQWDEGKAAGGAAVQAGRGEEGGGTPDDDGKIDVDEEAAP